MVELRCDLSRRPGRRDIESRQEVVRRAFTGRQRAQQPIVQRWIKRGQRRINKADAPGADDIGAQARIHACVGAADDELVGAKVDADDQQQPQSQRGQFPPLLAPVNRWHLHGFRAVSGPLQPDDPGAGSDD